MSIQNFNTENTNFIDPQFLLNISESENLKIFNAFLVI